jgi:hypothetical protein
MVTKRGAKPKPNYLQLIDGTRNPTLHASEREMKAQIEISRTSFGKLTMPKDLKKDGTLAWQRYVAPAFWLDASREPAAIAFCVLWGEFRREPSMFTAARHRQLRAYMGDLGLTDERNRFLERDEPDEFLD